MSLFRRYDDGLELHVVDHGLRWQLTLMLGGERVSGLGLVKKRMRVGGAIVRMGGIAGVWTAEDHRKKGFASRVMDASVDWMRLKGYETSILFGIRDFYHRYGFVEAFPESALDVGTSDLAMARSSLAVRTGRKKDLPSLSRLYNAHNRRRTGTVVRSRDWDPAWRLPRLGPGTLRRPGKTLLACDETARIRGYAVFDIQRGRCRVAEIVGVNGIAYGALARGLAQRARRGGCDRVVVHVPPGDPFIEHCNRFGSQFRKSFAGDGGSMARIVDVEKLMSRLLPEFQRRLDASEVGFTRSLALETDIGSVTIVPGRQLTLLPGTVANAMRVRVSQELLTLWVMGTRTVDDVTSDEPVTMPTQAKPALRVLFPRGDAYVWWPDRF